MDKKDDIRAAVEAHQRELLEPAAMLFAVQRVHGDKVREQTMKAYGQLGDAHMLTTRVLPAALLRTNGTITASSSTSERRNALFAAFVIGMETCESAIAEGRYLQASALLRQEMETLAQIKEVSAGKKNERNPNVRMLEQSLARLYGELSDAAHVSKHNIVRSATEFGIAADNLHGLTSGTRYFPAFDEGLARRSFSLHLLLTVGLIEELSIDLHERHDDDCFTEREIRAVNLALQLMRAEGMIEMDDTDLTG